MIIAHSDKEHFVQSFRRVLYLQQILFYNIQDLTSLKVTPAKLKNCMLKVNAEIERSVRHASQMTDEKTWQAISEDLEDDRLHDLSMLLEIFSDVKNIGQVVDIITQNKHTWAVPENEAIK